MTDFYVAFAVADKKKDLNKFTLTGEYTPIQLRSSGSCGLEALIWAYKKLQEFESEEKRTRTKPFRIIVRGDDKKRLRVYKKALMKHGFKLGRDNDDNEPCLIKEINNEK